MPIFLRIFPNRKISLGAPCRARRLFPHAGTSAHIRRAEAIFTLSARSGSKKQCLTPPRRRKESFPLTPKLQCSCAPFSPSRTTQNLISALPCGRARACNPSRRQRPSANSKGTNRVRRYSSTQISPLSKKNCSFFPKERQQISSPANHTAPPRPAPLSSLPQAGCLVVPRYSLFPCGRPQSARSSSDCKAPSFFFRHIPKAPFDILSRAEDRDKMPFFSSLYHKKQEAQKIAPPVFL